MRGERVTRQAGRARSIPVLVAALVGVAASPSAADAQHCAGAASFAVARIRLGAAAERREDRTRLTASLGVGGRRAFAEVSAGVASYDALRSTGALIGASGGVEREIAGRVHACPRVAVLVGIGPREIDGTDVNASTLDTQVGMDVGRAFALTPRVQLVPLAGASLRWARLVLNVPSAGESFRRSDFYGSIDAGLGTVIAQRVSIVPRISASIGALDDGAILSLTVAVGFGGSG